MRILIVDDHPMMSAGLKSALGAAFPQAELLSAEQVDDAIALLHGHRNWDLLLMDLRIPTVAEGMRLLHWARRELAAAPVLVLSSESTSDVVGALRAAGARGFVSKSKGPETLLAAVRLVLAGGEYFSPSPAPSAAGSGRTVTPCPVLIPRLWDVYHLLSEGLPNKLIGRRLDITEGVVKNYVTRILEAVGASNRGEAIGLYKEHLEAWRASPAYRGGNAPGTEMPPR
jgi:DNA-binding NarL/FixJ family response regulator